MKGEKEKKKELITVIYDAWADNVFPHRKTPCNDINDAALERLQQIDMPTPDGRLEAESILADALCQKEKIVFQDAFSLAMEILSGKIGYEEE